VIMDQLYGEEFQRRLVFEEDTFRGLGGDDSFVVGYHFRLPDPVVLVGKLRYNALLERDSEESLEETLARVFPDDAKAETMPTDGGEQGEAHSG
jgi:hypothetical protein